MGQDAYLLLNFRDAETRDRAKAFIEDGGEDRCFLAGKHGLAYETLTRLWRFDRASVDADELLGIHYVFDCVGRPLLDHSDPRGVLAISDLIDDEELASSSYAELTDCEEGIGAHWIPFPRRARIEFAAQESKPGVSADDFLAQLPAERVLEFMAALYDGSEAGIATLAEEAGLSSEIAEELKQRSSALRAELRARIAESRKGKKR